MGDFSTNDPLPPLFLSTYSEFSCMPEAPTSAAPASVTWVANLAILVPIVLPFAYPVRRVFWANGSTASSNAEFAILNNEGAVIYQTGAVAQSGASSVQYVTPTAFTLPAGRYFFSQSYSGTTNRGWGSTALSANILRMLGCLQVSAQPLVSPVTFAQVANALFPYCGITLTASGY